MKLRATLALLLVVACAKKEDAPAREPAASASPAAPRTAQVSVLVHDKAGFWVQSTEPQKKVPTRKDDLIKLAKIPSERF
jgi:hypothetical protein